MKIRSVISSDPFRVISSSDKSLISLVDATKGTMEVSKLASDVMQVMLPWNFSNPNKNKFLDDYDAKDMKKASRMCSTLTGDPRAGHPAVVNLVYKCIRQELEEAGSKHMNEPVKMSGRGAAVPAPIKTRVKNELYAIGQKSWQSIPLDQILWALRKNGLMALQEDGTEWSGMLMGLKECGDPDANTQRVSWPVAMQSANDAGEWIMTNTAVQLSWCVRRRDPIAFEIVVYMG